MKDLILIDFSWLYNKYYFVSSFALSNDIKGTFSEDVESYLYRMLSQFLTRVETCYFKAKIVVALDSPTCTLNNYKIYEGYKQNRDKEIKKEVYSCLDSILQKLVKSLKKESFAFVKAKGYEADQIISYMIKKYHDKYKTIIFSGDKDLIQLTAYENVFISDKFEKGSFIVKTDEELFQKFKNNKGEDFTRISTNKKDILKYRVLKGDTSDNLSPVFPRIKDKEIVNIVKDYWIDEEELTEERINDIIDDIKGDNPSLALKLEENKKIWLRNYKIMDLFCVDDIKVKRLL